MQENLQAVFDALTQLWNTGQTDLAGRVYSNHAVRIDPTQAQPARGVEEIVSYVTEIRKSFPDFRLEIKQSISEGDLVAVQWTCTGTHNGDYQGIPPTKRHVEIAGVTVNRIDAGKIVEERSYFDRLHLLQQLGVAP